MSAISPIVEENLTLTVEALAKMRALLEANAAAPEPRDAETLRKVYSLMLDASGPARGALGLLRMYDDRAAALEAADTERPSGIQVAR